MLGPDGEGLGRAAEAGHAGAAAAGAGRRVQPAAPVQKQLLKLVPEQEDGHVIKLRRDFVVFVVVIW